MSADTMPAENPSAPDKVREQLLPPAFFSPLNLLWVCVLPLILLLIINSQAIWLCFGEITEQSSRHSAQSVLLVNVAMILGLGAMGLLLRKAGRSLHTGWFLLLIGLHAAFIWVDLEALQKALPTSVPDWILSRDTLILSQLACVMPGCFYSLLGFACFPSRFSKGKDMLLSGALLVGVPLAWYLLMQLTRFVGNYFNPSAYVVAPFFILSTALMFIGLLRLLIRLHSWMRAYQTVLVLITALAFPLGGLLLNRSIPFPVNFQVTGIYVLTVFNGLALLAGSLPRFRQNPWIILGQVLTFPFTLYFFMIFLPFLPLFVPAMIVMGAGFLVLTPTVLFMVHGQRLLEGFTCMAASLGRLRVLLLFSVTLALLPGWFAGQAFLDRMTLHQGLDFIYTPKLYPREKFSGSPERMGRVLKNLVDFKEGQYLPILSDLYNRVVFDNLFLPDSKMEEMHQAFLGKPLPKAQEDRMADFSIWGATSNRRSRSEPRMRPLQLPREQAVIQSMENTQVEEGNCIRHTSIIRIKNNASVQNEFVATIDIPDGVLVSNYWLHIGKERVPGKLFEKKTALWVYEQIRDRTRRDPGILRYIGPNKLELRVFPLEAGEVRTTEIEFLCPGASLTRFHFPAYYDTDDKTRPESEYQWNGDSYKIHYVRSLEVVSGTSGGVLQFKSRNFVRADYPGGSALMLDGIALDQWPQTKQEGYLHFILDHSAAVSWTADQWNTRLKDVIASPELAGFSKARISLAHYESEQLPGGDRSLSAPLLADGELNSQRRKGGFLPDKVLKEEILAYEAGLSRNSVGAYPVFVVVSPASKELRWGESDSYFLRQGGYPLYEACGSESLRLVKGSKEAKATRHVIVGEADGSLFVIPPLGSWMGQFKSAEEILLWPEEGLATTILPEKVSHKLYEKGMVLWAEEKALRQNPSLRSSRLRELVQQSKETGILVPATSYIVVENSAQWKILQLKEKQKLAGHEVMELQEASEPSWLVVALLFAALAWLRTRFFPRKAEGLP